MDENLAQPGRRTSGLIMGVLMGLVYGLVANNINALVIREVPFHFSLSHSLANTIMAALVLGAMGYITNWPEHGVIGVGLTSLLGAAVIMFSSLASTDGEAASIFSALFVQLYLFLPFVVLFVPLNWLLRWSAARFYNYPNEPLLGYHKLRAILIVLGLAVLTGSFSLYDREARVMLKKMDSYVRATQKADAGVKIPGEFKPITRVVQSASAHYTLDWSDDLKQFPMALGFEDPSAAAALEMVTVYFDSGAEVTCLFRVSDQNLYLCAVRP